MRPLLRIPGFFETIDTSFAIYGFGDINFRPE